MLPVHRGDEFASINIFKRCNRDLDIRLQRALSISVSESVP